MTFTPLIEFAAGLPAAWLLVPAILAVFLLSRIIPPLERFGLIPRTSKGLPGVVTMVFLHDDLKHLLANLVPLVVLMSLLMMLQSQHVTETTVLIQLLGGFGLWIIGRRANHIGASLLVFGLVGFHIANGYLNNSLLTLSIAVFVALVYGGTFLASVVPWRRGTSWDGHICGFVAGAGIAYWRSENDGESLINMLSNIL